MPLAAGTVVDAVVHRDAGLFQQVSRHVGGTAQRRHVHPAQKARLGHLHRNAGDAVEHLKRPFAAAVVGIGKLPHEVRAGQRRQHRPLGRGGGGPDHRHRVGVHGVHDPVVADDVADPQAAQAHAFGEGEHRHGALEHAGQGGGGEHLVAEGEILKSLVHHQHQVMADDKVRQPFQRRPVIDGGGGVVGVGQHHHPGAGRHGGLHRRQVQLVAGLRAQLHRHRRAAHDAHVQKVVGVAGAGDQHLVAGMHKWQDGKVQAGVRAGGDQDVALRVHGQTVLGLELFGNGLFQLGVADGGCVVRGGVLPHGIQPGLLDKVRQGTVGHKGVGPAHQGNAAAFQLLVGAAHVGLLHCREQPALGRAESVGHFAADIHMAPRNNGQRPGSPVKRPSARLCRRNFSRNVLAEGKCWVTWPGLRPSSRPASRTGRSARRPPQRR